MRSDIYESINAIDDINQLKQINRLVTDKLAEIRKQHSESEKQELEKKYKDKYLLCYGKFVAMTQTTVNENDMTIIHVLDIKFQGNGFFRCHAKAITIKFNDEYDQVYHLTGDWGSTHIEYDENEQYDIRESDISKIITKDEANNLIKKAKEDFETITSTWDI